MRAGGWRSGSKPRRFETAPFIAWDGEGINLSTRYETRTITYKAREAEFIEVLEQKERVRIARESWQQLYRRVIERGRGIGFDPRWEWTDVPPPLRRRHGMEPDLLADELGYE